LNPSIGVVVALLASGAVGTGSHGRAQTGATAGREGFADVSGARLFYVDTGGSGPAIVLLHAGTGSARVWEHQVGPFVSSGLRVIAYDRRGFGRTVTNGSGPAGTAVDDLETLLTHLGLERVHLLGTAAGGIVATDYALSFPKRLRSLVIANSLVGVQDEEYLELGRRLRPKSFAALPPDVRELGPAYRAGNPSGTARWLELERVSRAPGPPIPPQPPKNRITFKALETISAPTLLITGDADLYLPAPAMQLFVKRIAHAETLVIPAVGHSAYWEAPEIFNRTVLAFIRKH
jgi:pimeloyl-ACP methyl ester carboxylesterase